MEQKDSRGRETAISVRNVSKSFRVYHDKSYELKGRLLFWKRNAYENRNVLRDVSFDIARGEAVGLVGHNGCGKSTTLKLLTRIMYPDSGTIAVAGRVSALIELGAGFHPDLSGRENIYTNAAIFGLSRREIDARIERIIAFSELGDYIDNPVRTYSSGMYMRLAFSVAINVDADVLFVDEILAVGDSAFQDKCLRKLEQIKAAGTTIVIVSHDLGQIERLCDRSIWINDGGIVLQGSPQEVHRAYLNYMFKGEKCAETPDAGQEREAVLHGAVLLDAEGKRRDSFRCGEELRIRVDYSLRGEFDDPILGLAVLSADGRLCYGTNTRHEHIATGKRRGENSFEFRIGALALMPGYYRVDLSVARRPGQELHNLENAAFFSVSSDFEETGGLYLPHTWIFPEGPAAEPKNDGSAR